MLDTIGGMVLDPMYLAPLSCVTWLFEEDFDSVYRRTPPNHGEKIEPMRNLVTRYVVSVLGKIGENECFREIL